MFQHRSSISSTRLSKSFTAKRLKRYSEIINGFLIYIIETISFCSTRTACDLLPASLLLEEGYLSRVAPCSHTSLTHETASSLNTLPGHQHLHCAYCYISLDSLLNRLALEVRHNSISDPDCSNDPTAYVILSYESIA